MRPFATLAALRRDRRGLSAVEFAIIAMPLIFSLLAIMQMSIYYMTQSALDTGVIHTADALVNTFYTTNAPTAPSVSSLQTQIVSGAGGLVHASSLSVDLQPFVNLTAGAVPIGINPPDIGAPRGLLALRAQANVVSFAPGFGTLLVVRSSALVRRQGQ